MTTTPVPIGVVFVRASAMPAATDATTSPSATSRTSLLEIFGMSFMPSVVPAVGKDSMSGVRFTENPYVESLRGASAECGATSGDAAVGGARRAGAGGLRRGGESLRSRVLAD